MEELKKNDEFEKYYFLDGSAPSLPNNIKGGSIFNDETFNRSYGLKEGELKEPKTYTDEINEYGLNLDIEGMGRYMGYFIISVFVIFYLITNFKFWINAINNDNSVNLGLYITQVLTLFLSSLFLFFVGDYGPIFQIIAGLSAILFSILFSVYIFQTNMTFYVPTTILLFGSIALMAFKDLHPFISKMFILGIVYYLFFMIKIKQKKEEDTLSGKKLATFITILVFEFIFLVGLLIYYKMFGVNLYFWLILIGFFAFVITNIILNYQDRSYFLFISLLILSNFFSSLYLLGGESSYFEVLFDSIFNFDFSNSIYILFLVLSFIASLCYLNGNRKWFIILLFQIIGQVLASSMYHSIGIRGKTFYILLGCLIGLIFGLIFAEVIGESPASPTPECCQKPKDYSILSKENLEDMESDDGNENNDNSELDEETQKKEVVKNNSQKYKVENETNNDNEDINENENVNVSDVESDESSLDLFGLENDD